MQEPLNSSYPVLPLRDIVVFPHMIVPLFVGREKSIKALTAAMQDDKRILLLAQRTADTDDPQSRDLYSVGTLASILQMLKLPDGTVKVLVEGQRRAQVSNFDFDGEFVMAECQTLPEDKETVTDSKELDATRAGSSPSATSRASGSSSRSAARRSRLPAA